MQQFIFTSHCLTTFQHEKKVWVQITFSRKTTHVNAIKVDTATTGVSWQKIERCIAKEIFLTDNQRQKITTSDTVYERKNGKPLVWQEQETIYCIIYWTRQENLLIIIIVIIVIIIVISHPYFILWTATWKDCKSQSNSCHKLLQWIKRLKFKIRMTFWCYFCLILLEIGSYFSLAWVANVLQKNYN